MINDTSPVEKYFNYIKDENHLQILSEKTAYDLNLDLLFFKLDQTFSKIGQQYFYSKFRLLENKSDQYFTKYVDYFAKNDIEKNQVAKQLSKLNQDKDYHLIDLISEDISVNERYYNYARLATLALTMIVISSFFVPKVLVFLIPLFFINFYYHYNNKAYVQYYKLVISRLSASIKTANNISKFSQFTEEFNFININKLSKIIGFSEVEQALVKNEYLLVIWSAIEFYRISFNTEIFGFRKKVKILKDSKEDLLKLVKFIGKIDTAITISEIKLNYKTCEPIFINKKEIKTENIYHPFIDNCVKNNLMISDKSLVLTGSNMSGKTTFMRCMTINSLFAQNFNLCFADSFECPKMQILTSISIQDNIEENKSYYLEEVMRIKTFLEKRDTFALILIDEIFSGTNTKERIAISKAVLSALNKDEKNLVVITTHDLEIAQFLEANNFELYYFDEDITLNKISFPYILNKGISQKTNAIKILEMYNYSDEIIKNARELL
ncbi:MutS domain V [Halpernia humi]|uniref:MutS domain V n=1 Tax=Halpernia humi TaxID=493375 RepID=A0A1H5SNT7_9FLAO|nr:DNA mismatch repair protein MutS [Halpernia humi]SEF52114.1 MutS domain V [Halpernia humi]